VLERFGAPLPSDDAFAADDAPSEASPLADDAPEEVEDRAGPERELADRSFLAQPEPLKWTADVVISLRIVPAAPQFGQNRGPVSWIPWMTSTTWRHDLQE